MIHRPYDPARVDLADEARPAKPDALTEALADLLLAVARRRAERRAAEEASRALSGDAEQSAQSEAL